MKLNTVLTIAVLFSASLRAAELPNIVLILADDQGWTGTSIQMDDRVPGSASDLYKTPNLERLAKQGMRFSNGYAPAPNCSPTRMSIQTGKTAARLGASDIIDVVPKEGRTGTFYNRFYVNKPLVLPLPISDLPDQEITIAEFLKRNSPDYQTAHFGKWHMGGGSPEDHGYDYHSGTTNNRQGNVGEPDPKRTGEVTAEAIQFITQQAERDDPFFVQVSYYAVHTPILAKGETIGQYSQVSSRQHLNVKFAAMTDELDQGVGAILDQIEKLGLSENTYVIYTSDNGGEVSEGTITNNVPLARGKTHVWEGGIRVPLLIRGPGISAGTQSNVPAIGYDFLPTIAEWVGAEDQLPDDLDGGSLVGVLTHGGIGVVNRGTDSLIWYYGAYRNHKYVVPQAAIRSGTHKLIWNLDSDRKVLFDLGLDLSETTDLSRFRPDVAKELERKLKEYLSKVGTKLPTRNATYDPTKDLGLRQRGSFQLRAGDQAPGAARQPRD